MEKKMRITMKMLTNLNGGYIPQIMLKNSNVVCHGRRTMPKNWELVEIDGCWCDREQIIALINENYKELNK